jgi:uncharacterized protein
MEVRRHASATAFLAAAGALIEAEEARCTHAWSVLARLEAEPSLASEAYLATVEHDGLVVGCATALHDRPLSLAPSRSEAAAALLAEDAVDHTPELAVAVLPSEDAGPFVARWQAITGRTVRLAMRQRLFACPHVVLPAGVPGTLRPAREADRPLLEAWVLAFQDEALDKDDAETARRTVDRSLAEGVTTGLVVWEDGGRPVSMAGFTGPTPNGITVLAVYTPPELRGHGYASACVASLTERLLRDRSCCFLTTDATNPTSNRIYERMGYVQVGEAEVHRAG